MKRPSNIVLLVWVVVNLLLISRYVWDYTGIRCEPCMSGIICAPCETAFMANFVWYMIGWNSTGLITWGAFRMDRQLRTR